MKRFISTLIILSILLISTPAIYASNIGYHAIAETSSYMNLMSSLLIVEEDHKFLPAGINLGLNGVIGIIPDLYIIMIDGLNLIYLLDEKLSLGIGARVNVTLGMNSTSEYDFALIGEYIFLNRDTYQLGCNLRLGSADTSISLLGAYNLSSSLALSGKMKASYIYEDTSLLFLSQISFNYEDYLAVILSMELKEVLEKNTEADFSRDVITLHLDGYIPVINKFYLSYLGSFYFYNFLSSPDGGIFHFDVGAGLKYEVTRKFDIELSYCFLRRILTTYEYGDVSTDPNYYHAIMLSLKYMW